MTELEINKIHLSRSAKPDRVYIASDTGKKFIGTKERRLRLIGNSADEITSESRANELSKIGDYSREEILDLLEQVTINEEEIKTKADKCYALAMALVL